MFLKPLISGERFFGSGLSIGVLWVRKHFYRGDLLGYYYWVISLHYYSSSSLDGYSTLSLIHLSNSRPSRKALLGFVKANLSHPTHPLRRDISNKTILTILFTSNMIGSLFARSLHYQFYSWTAWTMPFLLWRTGWNPAAQYLTWMIEEWAWNVFPSTSASSFAVVGVYTAVLAGVWWNWGTEEGVQGEWVDARFERETRIREGVTVA